MQNLFIVALANATIGTLTGFVFVNAITKTLHFVLVTKTKTIGLLFVINNKK